VAGTGIFSPLVHALPSSGGPLPATLEAEVMHVNDTNCDDIIAEEPHARGKHIIDKCKRAAWPWIASSMRLSQNFNQYRRMEKLVDVQLFWNNWSQVVNFKHRRCVRKPIRDVHALVYTLEDLPVFSSPGYALEDVAADSDDDTRAAKPRALPRVPDNTPLLNLVVSVEARALLSEYLQTIVKPNTMITVPAPSTHVHTIRSFQIVRKRGRNVLVKTFTHGNYDVDSWLVQAFDIWQGGSITLGQDRL
jgi:hypothetical protein